MYPNSFDGFGFCHGGAAYVLSRAMMLSIEDKTA
jgi:hypothetical protein